MSKLQIQRIYLLAQLERFGLNPYDWDVKLKKSKKLVEFTHKKHDDFKFLGVLVREGFLLKCRSLELSPLCGGP